jgi:5'-nucleotidase
MEPSASQIFISDPKTLADKTARLIAAGPDNLQVVSDFDRTLTPHFVDGQKTIAPINLLRLTPDYAGQAQALYDHYHPLEIDNNLSLEKKKEAMDEWWHKHFELLIASGMTRSDIENVVKQSHLKLRPGADVLLDRLRELRIPLVIFSASGLGEESISIFLEYNHKLSTNVHIVSNDFLWDQEGRAVGYREPVVHVFNKNETILHSFSFYEQVASRRQIILLGDSLGDLGMIEGIAYDNLIKVGFLNEEIEANLEAYQRAFDIVITNDGSCAPVNELLGF